GRAGRNNLGSARASPSRPSLPHADEQLPPRAAPRRLEPDQERHARAKGNPASRRQGTIKEQGQRTYGAGTQARSTRQLTEGPRWLETVGRLERHIASSARTRVASRLRRRRLLVGQVPPPARHSVVRTARRPRRAPLLLHHRWRSLLALLPGTASRPAGGWQRHTPLLLTLA